MERPEYRCQLCKDLLYYGTDEAKSVVYLPCPFGGREGKPCNPQPKRRCGGCETTTKKKETNE